MRREIWVERQKAWLTMVQPYIDRLAAGEEQADVAKSVGKSAQLVSYWNVRYRKLKRENPEFFGGEPRPAAAAPAAPAAPPLAPV